MSDSEKSKNHVDVFVIGGGINGVGIARDLAGRGLSVMLCEKNDLASATSSASTKLIHGGLRYLEHFEFGLVRAALKERETLLKTAPHIIWPLNFILPYHKEMRPRWLLRLGLFLYDFLGARKVLSRSRGLHLSGTALGQPLKSDYLYGFSYADCWVDDSRLVVLNALSAVEKGAQVYTRMTCEKFMPRENGHGWQIILHDELSGEKSVVRADMIVNAAGPWVNDVTLSAENLSPRHKVRLVKGSHIIVPRLYHGEQSYVLQNDDGRIVFVIPYEEDFSLIGTTEVEYDGALDEARIDMDEVQYLCQAVSRYFRHTVKPEQVQWTFSGVRPLLDDGQQSASRVTRDYILDLNGDETAPFLSIYGGKITIYRKLAERAADLVVKTLGRGGSPWSENESLPGAEMMADFKAFYKTFRREYNWLPEKLSVRLAQSYGTRARDLLRGMKRMPELGQHFGHDIYEAEIRYLVNVEWAMTAEDIFWRRSKLGLHASDKTVAEVEAFLEQLLDGTTPEATSASPS